MTRRAAIRELLQETDDILTLLTEEYERAKNDFSINSIPRVKVKSALEHMRSILDYAALDVYHYVYKKNPPKIYFPYGSDHQKFKDSIGRNLPGLEIESILIYKLIESIQPHCILENTLTDLCAFTNHNKHQNLTSQTKVSKVATTNVGNLVSFGRGGGQVVFENCVINGLPMEQGRVINLRPEMSDAEMLSQFDPRLLITISRVAGELKFKLGNTDHDALAFLTRSRNIVSDFVDRLYAIIE